MTMILYLNPEGAQDIIGPLSTIAEKMKSHPLLKKYTVEEFVKAFNRSEISHLGYISTQKEEESSE